MTSKAVSLASFLAQKIPHSSLMTVEHDDQPFTLPISHCLDLFSLESLSTWHRVYILLKDTQGTRYGPPLNKAAIPVETHALENRLP